MAKTAPRRRSQIARVLQFFREGHPDEIRAAFHIILEEGLVPNPPRGRAPIVRRRRRLNGADVISETNSQTREATA